MKKSFITLATVILIFLMVFATQPQVVLADGETPTAETTAEVEETPPPEEETEVPTGETEQSEEVEATSTEETSEELEIFSTPEIPESSNETADTLEQDDTIAEQSELSEEVTEEDNTLSVAEVLEQAPEGTQFVVLDSDGQVEPLVSQEAADIVTNGDPMWCPGNTPPGGTGCTISFNTFDELLDELFAMPGTYSGDGTIYVADTYDSASESGDITIDGTVFSNLGALTIQGGWDGGTGGGSANIVGNSTFGVSLEIINWGDQVTINDVIFNTTNDGLAIEASGTIFLNNVEVTNSLFSDGITINTDGHVFLSDVESSSNAFSGATISSGGNVSVNTSTFEDNDGSGANIFSDGSVNIQNSTFSSNIDGEGLYVNALGSITLNSVTASTNSFSGAVLINDGNVTVSNSTFSGNAVSYLNPGIEIDSTGIVTLSSVTASNNSGDGISIYNSPKVYLSDVTSLNNGWDGTYAEGDCISVYINNGTYSGNGFGVLEGYGVDVQTGEAIQAGTTIFSNNYSGNLFVDPDICYQIFVPGDGYHFDDNYNPVIQIIGGQAYYLACIYDTITLVTERDNRVTFEDVCDVDAIVNDITDDNPSITQIPDGMSFVNGISIELLYEAQLIDRLNSYSNILISFVIPTGMESEEFTVFYFGNSQLVKINNLDKYGNLLLVSGKFPGIYIVAKK